MAHMVTEDEQQSSLKHFCKICKKGFVCGRALGGHMRAHGIGDEGGAMDDDDDDAASDWEAGVGDCNNDSPSNKRMYALRTNPNRQKSYCRVCENCGKEFSCWKSFLEHGKCTSNDEAGDESSSFVSSPGSDAGDDMSGRRGCGGWSKRKRSFRVKVEGLNNSNNNPNCSSSNEDEDLANCLMMLSNATVDLPDDSSAAFTAGKDEERRNPNFSFMAPMTSSQVASYHNIKAKDVGNSSNINSKGLFECKACKKVFNSHQALGGHRASHKKVKGCFAARLDNLDAEADDDIINHEDKLFLSNKSNNSTHLRFDHGSNSNNSSLSKRKSKVHECSICHRVFTSGQALGGHKRCHWITSNAPDTSTLARFQQFHDHIEHHMMNNNNPIVVPNKFEEDSDPIHLKLDLNLPAAPVTTRNVVTEIYLQPWIGGGGMKQHKDESSQSHFDELEGKNSNKNLNFNNGSSMHNNVEDDEAESKVKLAKLSELEDMDVEGSSSPWLQVGIGSNTTANVGTDP